MAAAVSDEIVHKIKGFGALTDSIRNGGAVGTAPSGRQAHGRAPRGLP
jgi:hypothetical protein